MARSTSVDVQTALSMPMGGLSLPVDLMDQMANTLRVTLKVDDSDKLAALGSDMIVGVAEETTPPPKAILLVLVRTWAQYLLWREGHYGEDARHSHEGQEEATQGRLWRSSHLGL